MDAVELQDRIDDKVECTKCNKRARYCRCDGGPVVKFEDVIRATASCLGGGDYGDLCEGCPVWDEA